MRIEVGPTAVIPDWVPRGPWIDGDDHRTLAGDRITVHNPATEEALCEVADSSGADARAALACATREQVDWGQTPARDRAEILRRAYDLLQARRAELARLITLEAGKPLAEGEAEVDYGADFLLWFSEEAARVRGDFGRAPRGGGRIMVGTRPVGPSLLITPWNFPLAMATRKVGAAIAAGCTMVLKPATQAPLTALALVRVLADAGLPPGVLNAFTTSRPATVVEPLLGSPDLRKLSFTGSTEVGRGLIRSGADQLIRTSLELGGNAPLIVFEDADLDVAIAGAVIAKMRNTGQSCVAANRLYVAEEVAEQFCSGFVSALAALRMGPGLERGSDVGPLIDAGARENVAALVDDARARGARLLLGGESWGERGHFFQPTVLVDLAADARLLREEIFGPVAPIVTFANERQAVEAANSTPFGLVAYLFTRDLDRALRVIDALEVGMVGVNQGMVSNTAAPFGGIKHSGLGREGGREGIAEYLETTYAAIPG